NIRIGPAAAKIAAHALADFLVGDVDAVSGDVACGVTRPTRGDFLEQCGRGTDLSRRAIAALKSVMLQECALHGAGVVETTQPLDGRSAFPFVHSRDGQSAVAPDAIYGDSARAALSVVAALLGARQAEAITQVIEQRGSWVFGETT